MLSRYIARSIIYATLIILLILVTLQLFFIFIAEAPDIGQGNYHIWQSMMYVLMELPLSVYQFFPMAGLLGSLIGLSRLSADCELTVMRCSGVSILKISWYVTKAAVLLLIIITCLGEGIAYPAAQYATQYKNRALHKNNNSTAINNTWIRQGNNYIHIDQIQSNAPLHGLMRYHFSDQQQLISTQQANSAIQIDATHWLWRDIKQTNINNNATTTTYAPKKVITMELHPRLLQYETMNNTQLSLQQLRDIMKSNRASGLNTHETVFAFWQRIFQPLATLVMILLGIPFVFGSLRETSISARIIIGISVGFLFYIINQFIGPISLIYQVPPLLAALTPTALFFIIYLYLTTRLKH